MLLTQRQLLEISDLFGKDISEWSLFEIVTAWRALESWERGQLSTGGLDKKLKDMYKAFDLRYCSSMLKYKKELTLISEFFIKERIDGEAEPSSKNGANILPYKIWGKIIRQTRNNIGSQVGVKQLRAAQAYVLLCWTLSTGARLEELIRLRKSDLSLESSNGLCYIKITVRRGKRSRVGRKPVYYYAHENRTVERFCPVAAFRRYGELRFDGWPIFSDRSDLLFPQKVKAVHDGVVLKPKGSSKRVTARMITYNWQTTCKKLKLPKKWWVEAHSGRRQIINAAWAQNETNDQILDVTNWSSMQVLPEYVSGPKSTSINVKMTGMTISDLDDACKHIL